MVTKTLMRADDLLRLPDDGYRYELVRGELRRMSPVNRTHGRVALRLGAALLQIVERDGLGEVYVKVGFVLEHDPDTVRGPDVSFVSAARLAALLDKEGFLDLAPDLAVEVVSPGDTATEVQEKVDDYLARGTRLVWIVYPARRSVLVYRADGSTQRLREDDALDGEEVIPGFRLPLRELFRPA